MIKLIVSFMVLAVSVAVARAATLSTNYADVTVDNLQVGGVYNFTEVANLPMWVGYNGDNQISLKVTVVTPLASELKQGYEAVPDPSWITVSKQSFLLMPDESAELDVTVQVPNDEKYLGRKYQAYVMVTSMPAEKGGGFAVALALKGRVLFSIAPKSPTEAELRDLKRKSLRAQQGIIVTPERFTADVPAAMQRVEITADMPLKLINSSQEKHRVELSCVDPTSNGISVPRDYAKGDPAEVSFSRNKITVKPDGVENIKVFLNTKDKEVKKLFYAFRIAIKSQTLDVVKYIRVYVEQY